MRQMAISPELQDRILAIILLTAILLLLFGTMGCTLFGTSNTPDLTSKLATDLRQVRKEVSDVNQKYGDISGELTTISNRSEENSTEISNVSKKVSNIIQNNTPFWQIWLPIVGGYILWEIVKYKVLRRKKNA